MASSIERQLTCAQTVQALWEYLDGELAGDRLRRVREHLDACDGCRGLFTFEGAFLRTLSDLVAGEAPIGDLRPRIVRALRAQGYGDIARPDT